MAIARLITLFFCGISAALKVSGQVEFLSGRQGTEIGVYFSDSGVQTLPLIHFEHRCVPANKHSSDSLYFNVPFGCGTGRVYASFDGKIKVLINQFVPEHDTFSWNTASFRQVYSGANGVDFWDPCVADMNNDGLPDILIPNKDWSLTVKAPLSILLNKSNREGIHLEKIDFPLSDSSFMPLHYLRVMDIDADGDEDILASSRNKLYLYRNLFSQNQSVDFQVEYLDSFGQELSGIAWIDLDKDGVMEIIASAQTDVFLLSISDWNAVSISKTPFLLDTRMYYEVDCADLDGDGFEDIIVGNDTGYEVLFGSDQTIDTAAFSRIMRVHIEDGRPRYYINATRLYADSLPVAFSTKQLQLEVIQARQIGSVREVMGKEFPNKFYFSEPDLHDFNSDGILDFFGENYSWQYRVAIFNVIDTGGIPRGKACTNLNRVEDIFAKAYLAIDLDTNGVSEGVIFSFDTKFHSWEVYQYIDEEFLELKENLYKYAACSGDKRVIEIDSSIRIWHTEEDTSFVYAPRFTLSMDSVSAVRSKPQKSIDTSERVWNGSFYMADTLGSAKIGVVYNPGNSGYLHVLKENAGNLIWQQRIEVEPYANYTFSFVYSTMAWGQTQPIPIRLYAGYRQWSNQITLGRLWDKNEAFHFKTGAETFVDLAIYFETYGTFLPVPPPEVNFSISDISCKQTDWTWRLDTLVDGIPYPVPEIQQEEDELSIITPLPNSKIYWYKDSQALGEQDVWYLDTDDSGYYWVCAETPNHCLSCSDSFYASRWNPLGLELETEMFEVYPNPTQHNVSIYWNVKQSSATIELFDQQGRKLMAQTMEGDETVLDLSTIPDGIYILRISGGKGVHSVKLVVMH